MSSIVVFRVGETYFGLETSFVRAITKDIAWTDNDAVVEYQGQKIGVIALLEKRTENHSETDFIVVICKNKECVIPVDEIKDIFQAVENDIEPIPPFAAKTMKKNFFRGVFPISNALVLLLDVRRF